MWECGGEVSGVADKESAVCVRESESDIPRPEIGVADAFRSSAVSPSRTACCPHMSPSQTTKFLRAPTCPTRWKVEIESTLVGLSVLLFRQTDVTVILLFIGGCSDFVVSGSSGCPSCGDATPPQVESTLDYSRAGWFYKHALDRPALQGAWRPALPPPPPTVRPKDFDEHAATLFPPRTGFGLILGFSNVGIVPDDAAGRRFSRGSPMSPAPSFRRCSIFASLPLFIGSQDLDFGRCRHRGRSESWGQLRAELISAGVGCPCRLLSDNDHSGLGPCVGGAVLCDLQYHRHTVYQDENCNGTLADRSAPISDAILNFVTNNAIEVNVVSFDSDVRLRRGRDLDLAPPHTREAQGGDPAVTCVGEEDIRAVIRVESPAGSLPDFRTLVGGFSRGSPFPPALAFRRCSVYTSLHPHRLPRRRCSEPLRTTLQAYLNYYEKIDKYAVSSFIRILPQPLATSSPDCSTATQHDVRWYDDGTRIASRKSHSRPERLGVVALALVKSECDRTVIAGNTLTSHSGGPWFDFRSGHPDFGFPWFPEITPGELWDGSHTKAMADSLPNPSSLCNLHRL
ncbi:hypothetical protein PR048_003805 [Dryococelus australis]|uniref:Uncharacterized protein n=1 Tax=Dryococelus australis TaxID=614101 RepID=A0ABQ9IP40_9NEOP|nr:hypothetical protein PR048_003805 [Dryococelus australis]